MAVELGRAVLKRYPGLRSTWPLQQASAWRQRQNWRAHPRRMGSGDPHAAALRSRLFVSSLEIPEAPKLCQPVGVMVRLYDQAGNADAARRFAIPRNAS